MNNLIVDERSVARKLAMSRQLGTSISRWCGSMGKTTILVFVTILVIFSLMSGLKVVRLESSPTPGASTALETPKLNEATPPSPRAPQSSLVAVMTPALNSVGGGGYCPPLSSTGVCDDSSVALEVSRMTSGKFKGKSILYYRDAITTTASSSLASATGHGNKDHDKKDDDIGDVAGFLAANGVGYVGGVNERSGETASEADDKEEESAKLGDVDSFIVAVRRPRRQTSASASASSMMFRNEAFRRDILQAMSGGREATSTDESPYHTVLHETEEHDVQLYSVEERAADASVAPGLQCEWWWCKKEGRRQADDGGRGAPDKKDAANPHHQQPEATSASTVSFEPLEVDAVVAHVDGAAPGFLALVAKYHAAFGAAEMCSGKPPRRSNSNNRRGEEEGGGEEEEEEEDDGGDDDDGLSQQHEWRQRLRAKLPSDGGDPSQIIQRFRDWGEVRYCLRGVFSHGRIRHESRGGQNTSSHHRPAGFRYRRVFLVVNTVEHAPEWLRKRAIGDGKYIYEEALPQQTRDGGAGFPLLTIVPHSAFIPQCALPTFSSLAIEPFLYRIPGLSRWFVYINDDTVVSRPMSFLDYFAPLPSVRQYAKVEALKRRHGEDVFSRHLGGTDSTSNRVERRSRGDEKIQQQQHQPPAEVVFLELSLYEERRIEAFLSLKKPGRRVQVEPHHQCKNENNSSTMTSKKIALPKGRTDRKNRLKRRVDQYDKYLTMLHSRLATLNTTSTVAEEVAPLRPSAFFDFACRANSPRYKEAVENGMFTSSSSSTCSVNRGSDGGLVETDFHPAPLSPLGGYFSTPAHTCYNAHLIFKKIDGADPFYYFPHMSPLFDGRLLRRMVGVPYVGEDPSPSPSPNPGRGGGGGRVRGVFEAEFAERTVHNPIRYATDPTVPMLFQPFAASQRRYFTKLQLSSSSSASSAAAAIRDYYAKHHAYTAAKRNTALQELIHGVKTLRSRAQALSTEGSESADNKFLEEESEVARRAVARFGVGYSNKSEWAAWTERPLPSNEMAGSPRGGGDRTTAETAATPSSSSPEKSLCAPSSCPFKPLIEGRLSLRPHMPNNATVFFQNFGLVTLNSRTRDAKKWKKARPLFVTVNDDIVSLPDRDVPAVRRGYAQLLSHVCGPNCAKAPWEEEEEDSNSQSYDQGQSEAVTAAPTEKQQQQQQQQRLNKQTWRRRRR